MVNSNHLTLIVNYAYFSGDILNRSQRCKVKSMSALETTELFLSIVHGFHLSTKKFVHLSFYNLDFVLRFITLMVAAAKTCVCQHRIIQTKKSLMFLGTLVTSHSINEVSLNVKLWKTSRRIINLLERILPFVFMTSLTNMS